MRAPAKPKVNFYVQVPPEISELRCRLQEQTGFSGSELVSEALLALAARLGVATDVNECCGDHQRRRSLGRTR
jgi:hypothetical protein